MDDRLGIGGNSPPAHEAFMLAAEDMLTLASDNTSVPVTTDEQESALSDLLDDLRKMRRDADKHRKEEKKPFDDGAKAVQARWLPVIDRLDHAALGVKKHVEGFRIAKQKAKDEAARKAREEAEAKQQAAQQALRNSDDLEERFAAEEQLKQADKLVKAANRADREATGLRTVWRAEITDMRSAMLAYMKREPDRFRSLVEELAAKDARGTRAPVAGVLFIETKEAV